MADSVIAELRGNPDKIEAVLDKTGFYNIKNKGKHIHFAFDDEGGNGSCVVDIENLNYYRFSRSEGGDIFSAIMQKKELKFPQSISYIKGLLGLDNSSITFIDRKDKEKLFGGVFNKYKEDNYRVYSINEIDYKLCISDLFLKDKIDAFTQSYFDVRYDMWNERIVITWKDKDGNIVGFNNRANFELPEGYQFKYLTSEGFVKNNHLFGLYENKDFIQKSKAVIVVESEKSVMQAFSFGYRNIVALGSSNFSERQLNLLLELGVTTIVYALDEGSDFIKVSNVLDRFKNYKDKVGFCYIKNYNRFISGSKDSPTDNGKDVFMEILKNDLIQYKY